MAALVYQYTQAGQTNQHREDLALAQLGDQDCALCAVASVAGARVTVTAEDPRAVIRSARAMADSLGVDVVIRRDDAEGAFFGLMR